MSKVQRHGGKPYKLNVGIRQTSDPCVPLSSLRTYTKAWQEMSKSVSPAVTLS